MAFRIMLVGSDKVEGRIPVFAINPATACMYEFETGPEAQAIAKSLSAAGDERKWRVKRILDAKWKTREQMKFETGVYTSVPWIGTYWWDSCRELHRHHYPHVSRSIPGMMAYTESAEKGMDNKQTQIKPGRYLEKYFGDMLRIHGISIKKIVSDFDKLYKPRPVHFAVTEDEIQAIYERGPRSCMSSAEYRRNQGWGWPSPGLWPNNTHACRVYAAGDLQVAYLTHSGKPTGRIEARALVWPAKKTHSRCYGSEAALRNQLSLLGYKPDAPIGAKLLRIPIKVHGVNLFICPYIDIGQRAGAGATAVKDMKDHLIIVNAEPGAYAANSTSGLSGNQFDGRLSPVRPQPTHCDNCAELVAICGEPHPVYRGTNGGDYNLWCAECINTGIRPDIVSETGTCGAYQCAHDGRYYNAAYLAPVEMYDGSRWSPRAFRAHGFRSDADGRNYHSDNRVRMYNGKKWHYEHFERNGFTCWYSGDHFPNELKVDTGNGRCMGKPVFDHYGFTCEGCNKLRPRSDKQKGGLCIECGTNEYNMALRLVTYRVPSYTEEYDR